MDSDSTASKPATRRDSVVVARLSNLVLICLCVATIVLSIRVAKLEKRPTVTPGLLGNGGVKEITEEEECSLLADEERGDCKVTNNSTRRLQYSELGECYMARRDTSSLSRLWSKSCGVGFGHLSVEMYYSSQGADLHSILYGNKRREVTVSTLVRSGYNSMGTIAWMQVVCCKHPDFK